MTRITALSRAYGFRMVLPRWPDRLAQWLLTGPAQLADGPHAGAVAGCVDATGAARYAYPEITGYYLHWLAWRAAVGRDDADDLAAHAAAAQRWLARWLAAHAFPPTRIHLEPDAHDWRNDAVFCFDVAMVLRGLAAATREELVAPDAAVVAGLTAMLRKLIGADGQFDACVSRERTGALPERWSTRRGGFLAKAAAGVIDAARVLPGVPADVVAAAEATYAASVRAFLDAPHDEVHPLLYACEGILSLPDHPRFAAALPHVAATFAAVLAAERALGRVPETLLPGVAAHGHARYDVLAQAVRVGHLLLRHRPDEPIDRVGLSRLAQALARCLKPHGAVPFASGAGHALDNVWATMFAEQALALGSVPRASHVLTHGGALLV